MSIQLLFYNIIIPKKVLQAKYKGGLSQFILDCPNQTFQEDEDLVGVGFMSPTDVELFISNLQENGLEYKNNQAEDFVVTNSFFGNLWEVDWLDRDFHYCWMKGKTPTHKKDV